MSGILISISEGGPGSALRGILLACAILPGLTLALLWRCSLSSYRGLNEAKYGVIIEIEKMMLATRVHPYADEWDALQKETGPGKRRKHKEIGWAERQVPLVFMLTYIGIGLSLGIAAIITAV